MFLCILLDYLFCISIHYQTFTKMSTNFEAFNGRLKRTHRYKLFQPSQLVTLLLRQRIFTVSNKLDMKLKIGLFINHCIHHYPIWVMKIVEIIIVYCLSTLCFSDDELFIYAKQKLSNSINLTLRKYIRFFDKLMLYSNSICIAFRFILKILSKLTVTVNFC